MVDHPQVVRGREGLTGGVDGRRGAEGLTDDLRVGALDELAVVQGELVPEVVGVAVVRVHAVAGRDAVADDEVVEPLLRSLFFLTHREGKKRTDRREHDHSQYDSQ